ncbi:UDP-N-acetylglucosamine transporter UGNT1 [Citrus sinensis]|uniref:UDP-N-acetylglucosamine transporter UGNT1 n=1 Tax=Citrus sinensis TaxID=2711 RepID=A0ACB8P5K3_CITSI|nr:UDP-N-acetylglucosamine transporter UGNT1 [Citrus sinensis]
MASSMKSDELPVTVNDSLKRQEQPKGSAAMTKRGVYAAASYMASAVLLIMFNKAALSSYSFPCANVITLFQMFCSCSILYALRCWKIISFTVGEPHTTSNNPTTLVPLKTLVHTLPLALSYLLYMLITMEAVRGINVPMYTTLRRTTVAFTMIVEYLLTGQKHSLPVVGSVGIILLGAFLAGARDLSFDAYGYAVVFIANICTAAYLAFISRIGRSSGLSSFGLMWCNGCDASFLYHGILNKLLRIFEHNPQFSTHTDNLCSISLAKLLAFSGRASMHIDLFAEHPVIPSSFSSLARRCP